MRSPLPFVACLLAFPAAAAAQYPQFESSIHAAAALDIAAGTARAPAPALDAVLVPLASPVAPLVQARAARNRAPGVLLMIVGGAVAAAGLVTDESVLVVGGVGLAGYGLYLYLR